MLAFLFLLFLLNNRQFSFLLLIRSLSCLNVSGVAQRTTKTRLCAFLAFEMCVFFFMCVEKRGSFVNLSARNVGFLFLGMEEGEYLSVK